MKSISTDRLFIFGGAYGNLAATEAILAKAKALGYQAYDILFTGDSIAYCANPEETAQLIKHAGVHSLMGNCEEAIASGADDCGCGFEEGTECDLLSDQWYRFCQSNISAESRRWMSTLPEQLEFSIGDCLLLAVHATPFSNNQFVFPSSLSPSVISDKCKYDGYLAGHSGIPFISQTDNALWLNSGAAGMPANDGTPRVWYATLELKAHNLDIKTHALEYDHDASASAMHMNGLNNGYMDCLSNGIWPSHDVLSEAEKLKTGAPLKEQELSIAIKSLVGA